MPGQEITDPGAWELEAEYLAHALVNMVCVGSPQRIVIGGGVAHQPTLLPMARQRMSDLLAGYLRVPELTQPDELERFIVLPGLGDRAGVVGALELARDAVPDTAVSDTTRPAGSAGPNNTGSASGSAGPG